jgi:serine phosphatase RsbU (regulator of sigma subunit)
MAEYDDERRRLRYANCGHLPALLLRSDNSVDRLESTSTVLGLFRNWDCEIGERNLGPGDTLAVYTDGITESFNDAGEEFGEERLTDSLRRHRHLPWRLIKANQNPWLGTMNNTTITPPCQDVDRGSANHTASQTET